MMHQDEIPGVVGNQDPAQLERGEQLLIVRRSNLAVAQRRQDIVRPNPEERS